jgi:hypothetical protein
LKLKDSSIVANRIKTINMLSEVKRPGIPDLVEYLDNTGYFLSPASTKYHNNFQGGLCLHSLNVTKLFIPRILKVETSLNRESAILCGLLHDLCKVGYYIEKNGEWKSNKEHEANSSHGVLSVQIIEKFIKLTPEEEAVIKYHMGLFSILGYVKEYTIEDLYEAISQWPSVQIFASCDNEDAHFKIKKR